MGYKLTRVEPHWLVGGRGVGGNCVHIVLGGKERVEKLNSINYNITEKQWIRRKMRRGG